MLKYNSSYCAVLSKEPTSLRCVGVRVCVCVCVFVLRDERGGGVGGKLDPVALKARKKTVLCIVFRRYLRCL